MNFDLTDLRLFLDIAEAGSITRGAARSGLALPSASARIRGMEVETGTRLLERGRRGVQPTAAGRTMAYQARLVLEQMDHLRGEVGAYAGGLKGHVRLLANTAAAAEALPPLLASFLIAQPSIDIDVDERPSAEVVHAVADGQAEIGVAADHADMAGLELSPFGTDRLVLIVPPGHGFAEAGSMAFADALAADFVGLGGDSALHQHLLAHASRAGQRMRLRVRARGIDVVCRMVALGAGVAVVPEAAARRAADGLGIVALRDPWAVRRLHLVVRRMDALPRPAQLLAHHLLAPHLQASGGDRA